MSEMPKTSARPLGIGLLCGAAVGILIGLATGNLPLWLGLGAGGGLLLGLAFARIPPTYD
jgi:hypothetical protein